MKYLVRNLDCKRVARAFKLYKQLSSRANNLAMRRPNGNWGIAVADDHHAKEWRKLSFRMHVLESWLTGEKINWWNAKWLTNEECEQRTKEQHSFTLVTRYV